MGRLQTETHQNVIGRTGIELKVNGIVQGVGFRPYVYRLAKFFGLSGTVANTGDGVVIQAEGTQTSLHSFIKTLERNPPPLTRITSLEHRFIVPRSRHRNFSIIKSKTTAQRTVLIPPDVAICSNCLQELFDKKNRRFRYPFINCTNCGPRFTIIESTPYDRSQTSMKVFPLCRKCTTEYQDPADRRYHAQPNACWSCGPELSWHDAEGRLLNVSDPVSQAARMLREGRIVAIQGLGGFHLSVNAFSEAGVTLLRNRKRRKTKALAVMVPDLETAKRYCIITRQEAALLRSHERPIVLLQKKIGSGLASGIAPGIQNLGIMLPCAPLEYLLLNHNDTPCALVMTSGNFSEEPICTSQAEAFKHLAKIADFFLAHNRKIVTRVDDSVAKIVAGSLKMIRRSRGYVPKPIGLDFTLPELIACGAELKNTFCLIRGSEAFLSQHIGDLTDAETMNFFRESVDHMQNVLEIRPRVVVCDQHPDYLSTRYATDCRLPLIAVQHHHAHAVSVMAEHGLKEDVLAVILDGTGYGTDGTVWGGEILLSSLTEYRRLGHLEHLLFPGGDAAVREPWRMGFAALWNVAGPERMEAAWLKTALHSIPEEKKRVIREMMTNRLNSPLTSSCGRLFDAAAALLGVCLESDYEGHAAMELESLALQAADSIFAKKILRLGHPDYPVYLKESAGVWIINSSTVIKAIMHDLGRGVARSVIAFRFHVWLIQAITMLLRHLSIKTNIKSVVLGGGCMQNSLLLEGLFHILERQGLQVYSGIEIPANDGGISLGQAVIGGLQYVLSNTNANC